MISYELWEANELKEKEKSMIRNERKKNNERKAECLFFF